MHSKMKYFWIFNNTAAALVTVVILIFILVTLGIALLSLLSSQVRLIEHDISRTYTRYAEEAAMVKTLELLRKNKTPPPSFNIDGIDVTIGLSSGTGLNGTDALNLSHDYSVSF